MRGRAGRPLHKTEASGEKTARGLGLEAPFNARAGINNINAILHSADYATLNRRRFSGGAILHNAPVHYVYWHDVVFSRTFA